MNRRHLTAIAVASTGLAIGLVPTASAETGSCSYQGEADGIVIVHGDAFERCLVVEGDGNGVKAVDRGYVGVYENEDGGPSFYASCVGRETEDDEFDTVHPTASGSFSRECREA